MDEKIVWSNELRTGNIVVDTQHKMLFEVCDKFETELKTTDISAIINELIHYTKTHFGDEEQLMIRAGFPKIEEHIELHKKMLGEVEQLAKRCTGGQLSDMIRLRLYVQKWLRDHILTEDFEFVEFLKKK